MTAEQSKALRGAGYSAAEIVCPRGERIVWRL
jgi:hypothetical protein